REQGHQRNESAVAAAIKPHAFRIDSKLFLQKLYRVHVVSQVFAAHVPINSGAPVAPITGAATIIDIEHHKAALHQKMIEHEFAVVVAPPAMHVLQITGAVYKQYRGAAGLVIGRDVQPSPNRRAVSCFETNEAWINPILSEEFRRG